MPDTNRAGTDFSKLLSKHLIAKNMFLSWKYLDDILERKSFLVQFKALKSMTVNEKVSPIGDTTRGNKNSQ